MSDPFLSALDDEAREHLLESNSASKRRLGSTPSASNAGGNTSNSTRINRPVSSLLDSLDDEARELRTQPVQFHHRTSSASHPATARPSFSLLDSLDDEARELRGEDLQRRRGSTSIPYVNVNDSVPVSRTTATPAMPSVSGGARVRLPGDLVSAHLCASCIIKSLWFPGAEYQF